MPKKIDLTGQTFGFLKVLHQGENIRTPNNRSHITWVCECKCGKIINVRSDSLRSGHTTSCGCRHKEVLAMAGKNRISDLVEKEFGYLKVIRDSGKRDNRGGVLWECQCVCGNIAYVSTSNLTRKKEATISCGCKKSKGEAKIINLLIKMDIPFVSQKRFDSCIYPETNSQLIFDFYLPVQNILIEYDGEQHFHPIKKDRFDYEGTQARDEYKTNWCKENNIVLIRIPYTDFEILDENYMRAIINSNGWREIR